MASLIQLPPEAELSAPGGLQSQRSTLEILRDSHGRQITDLRFSITDRCNYKRVYCRIGNVGAQFAKLKTEDYLRLIRNFVVLGIKKIRLTGGEPLLRRDLPEMVGELASWRTHKGETLDLAITTNGHLLEHLARPLKDPARKPSCALHRIHAFRRGPPLVPRHGRSPTRESKSYRLCNRKRLATT